MLNDAFIGIRRNVKVYSFTEGLKRLDVPEYPLEALREAITNAVVHRDYFDRTTEVFIKIFTDRIEFLNPASFPFENYSFDEIRQSGLSKRRNPLLAQFFEDMHYMEQEGRGLTTIQDLMKKHGLPNPEFEVGSNTFKLILRTSPNPDSIKHSPYARIADFTDLNARQLKFIEYLKEHGNRPTSRKEYMTITETDTEKTASRDLEDLTQRRVVQRIGETRGTRYFLIRPS
jgi:ATP-dependent DNA helicase RecG